MHVKDINNNQINVRGKFLLFQRYRVNNEIMVMDLRFK